jgi:hypothetical protein
METNIDLKKIWNTQKIETPKVEILYTKANKLKSRSFLRLIVVNITLLLTITFIGFIWYYYQPELITTKIGIILTILALIIFLLPFNKQFSLFTKKKKTEHNSKEYLQKLIKLKEIQVYQQTTMLSIYFIILSLGIGLYLFEYVSKMTTTWGIITYTLTIIWFAVSWFYLRPKAITKQNAKLNNLLVEFKKLNNQLNE